VLLSIVMHWFMFWAYSDVDVNQARDVFLYGSSPEDGEIRS
jgi:hypothetical protein